MAAKDGNNRTWCGDTEGSYKLYLYSASGTSDNTNASVIA